MCVSIINRASNMQSKAWEEQQPDAIANIPFNFINFAKSFVSEGGGGSLRMDISDWWRADPDHIQRGGDVCDVREVKTGGLWEVYRLERSSRVEEGHEKKQRGVSVSCAPSTPWGCCKPLSPAPYSGLFPWLRGEEGHCRSRMIQPLPSGRVRTADQTVCLSFCCSVWIFFLLCALGATTAAPSLYEMCIAAASVLQVLRWVSCYYPCLILDNTDHIKRSECLNSSCNLVLYLQPSIYGSNSGILTANMTAIWIHLNEKLSILHRELPKYILDC